MGTPNSRLPDILEGTPRDILEAMKEEHLPFHSHGTQCHGCRLLKVIEILVLTLHETREKGDHR